MFAFTAFCLMLSIALFGIGGKVGTPRNPSLNLHNTKFSACTWLYGDYPNHIELCSNWPRVSTIAAIDLSKLYCGVRQIQRKVSCFFSSR